MAKSNIYMNDITTSTTEASVDLSALKNIELTNLDDTNSIVLCWDVSNATATEKITLQPNTDDNDEESYSVKLPKDAVGGTLYYDASAGTPIFRVTGVRL